MTTPPTSPTDGPTSAAAVADFLSQGSTVPAGLVEKLGPTVAAVNGFVRRAATTSADEQALGATMLAARVWRRRQTPEGVATYTAEGGLVGVAKSDPEVWMLLGLGSWAPPVIG